MADGIAMLHSATVSGATACGVSLTIATDKGLVAIDVPAGSAAAVQRIAKPLLASLRPANL